MSINDGDLYCIKKYRVIIPQKVHKETKIKPGDKMVAIAKHGIIHYIPVRPINDTKGFILGLDTENLCDELDRID
jgi:bifunctional DNA-binding transcriptional regulator/antitoxin component of YhaV-PrlF toxin-antitoxin module